MEVVEGKVNSWSEIPSKYMLLTNSFFASTYVEEGTFIHIPVKKILKAPSPSRLSTNIQRLYEIVKVCERCYIMYNLIRTLRTRRNI